MNQHNPFPDYPVVRLQDDAKGVGARTHDTDAIEASRTLLKAYIRQWKEKYAGEHAEVEPLIVRVEGDYGTGKTHLLLDAIAQVQHELGSLYPALNIMRVTCAETDPVQWYRSTIGGELARPFLIDMIVRLYAEAGKDVAEGAELTRAAVQRLEKNHQDIYELIQASALNISKVNDRFSELIAEICKEAGEDLRKVLAGLVWDGTQTISMRWLAGNRLTEDELKKLRVSAPLTTDKDAADVLTVVAAIHQYLNCPFGLFIDELEHWAKYDLSHHSDNNMNWLKGLIRNLAAYKSLVFICGRVEAWLPQVDVVDSFTTYKSIRLEKLKPERVESIVRTILEAAQVSPLNFGPEQARAVTECTGGIIRRVLSFCRFLFRESIGFSQTLSAECIRQLAEEAGQRLSLDEAKLVVHEFLEKQDLRVLSSDDSVGNIEFDLVGYDGNQPRVIAEFKHAVTQPQHLDAVQRFIQQMKEVYSLAPEAFGCFVADGNVEQSVQSAEAGDLPFKIFWFDLTERDVLAKIAKQLGEHLKGAPKSDGEAARFKGLLGEKERVEAQLSEARRSENQELIAQLQLQRKAVELQVESLRAQLLERNTDFENYLGSLEAQRSAELNTFYRQLEKLSERLDSRQEVNVIAGGKNEVDARLHATYTELTRPLSFSKKIRLSLPGQTIIMVGMLLITSLALIFTGDYLAGAMFPPDRDSSVYNVTKLFLTLIGIIISVSILLFIWRKLTELDRYTDFSARILREIYLRSSDPTDLIKADNILRDMLEDMGPLDGKEKARKVLSSSFPEILDHLNY